jgi:4'-phosphopantetheinyl transferase
MDLEQIFNENTWAIQTIPLPLGDKEVHVWSAMLDLEPTAIEELNATLNQEEKSRAARFKFPSDRRRFIAARGILRDLLSNYLNVPAAELSFRYGDHGKPSVVNNESFCFNVSHTQGAAMFAFTHGNRVGIDIEYVRDDIGAMEIADRFFSAGEVAALSKLAREQQTQAFFHGWTRKEAYIKAVGGSIALLHGFEVSLSPGQPAALLNCEWDEVESGLWSMHDLSPSSKYLAALVIERTPQKTIHQFRWAGPITSDVPLRY